MADVQSIFELRAIRFAEYQAQVRESRQMAIEDVSTLKN